VAYEHVAYAMGAAQRAGIKAIGFVTEARQP
jgi:biopolymer transport protein ExbD